jgi:hypothetical protein
MGNCFSEDKKGNGSTAAAAAKPAQDGQPPASSAPSEHKVWKNVVL